MKNTLDFSVSSEMLFHQNIKPVKSSHQLDIGVKLEYKFLILIFL